MKTVDFAKVIGLSKKSCPCLPVPIEGSKDSLSGLYLDETEGLSLKVADSGSDCEDSNVWEMMAAAREEAVRHFEADLLARLGDAYEDARPPFVGSLGTTSYRGRVEEGAEGFTIKRGSIDGATFLIDRVGALVNYDGEVQISFPVSEMIPETGEYATINKTFTVVCAAYTPTLLALPAPVLVPMNGKAFKVTLALADGGQALDNSIPCGCGMKDTVLRKYFPELPSSAGGAILDGSITCDPSLVLGRSYSLLPKVAKVMAFALRYKAAELLLESIYASGEINRFTMMERTTFWGKRDHYRKEYTSRLEYLTGENGINPSLCGCFAAKPEEENSIRKGKILI